MKTISSSWSIYSHYSSKKNSPFHNLHPFSYNEKKEKYFLYLFVQQKSKTTENKLKNIINALIKVRNINELIKLAKEKFPESKQYLFDIIEKEVEAFEEEKEEDIGISLESFKGMLLFLYGLSSFAKPEISISETGVFYLDWEKADNNSLTIRFKDNFFLEYSLFSPSKYTDKLNIRSGMIHVLDFKKDIDRLGINCINEL